MSIQAVAAVLDHSKSVLSARLTAISFANHADKNGVGFASIRLAAEEAKVSHSTAKNAMRTLRTLGEIETVVGGHGKTHRPPLLRLALPGLSGEYAEDHPYFVIFGSPGELKFDPGSDSAPGPGSESDPDPGHPSDPPGVRFDTPPGSDSDPLTYKEPSVNRQRDPGDGSPGYLCNLLADLMAENDPNGKRPPVSERWLNAERLMLARDERDVDQAERVLRWCQADEFWRANIQSMPKFREKFGALFLQANRQPAAAPKPMERAQPQAGNVYDLGVVRSGG